MSPRQNPNIIKEVMKVRKVQRLAAEMQVMRATANLRQLDASRDESVNRLQDEHDCWSQVVSGPSLGLHFAGAWSKVILRGQAELGQIDAQIDEAEDERARRSGEWRAAQARADAAKAMGDRVARHERRLREEVELANVADRFIQRGVIR
jgi:hypothetical protein